MAWLKRPVFSEDGKTWWLEKYREVSDGTTMVEVMVQTPEEFLAFWKPMYVA